MTKETLLEIINDVDEDLIENVPMEKVKKKSHIIRYIAVAASVIVVVGVSFTITKTTTETETKMAQGGNGSLVDLTTTFLPYDNATFIYNNSNYRIVKDEEYLMSNSLPVSVDAEQLGACLQNNVGDSNNNMLLGDLYEYEGNDSSVLIVKLADGSYEVAVQEGAVEDTSAEE